MTVPVKRSGSPPGAAGARAPAEAPVGITDIGRRLSTATDQLSEKLMKVEKRLAGLQLGVSAAVDISDENDRQDGRYTELAFQKRGPKWGLFIVTGRHTMSAPGRDDDNETAIVNATKKQRVRAAEVINDLLAALIQAARDQLAVIERANKSLDEALEGALRDVALADDPLADPPADYAEYGDDIPF
jgi:hypothetical protein